MRGLGPYSPLTFLSPSGNMRVHTAEDAQGRTKASKASKATRNGRGRGRGAPTQRLAARARDMDTVAAASISFFPSSSQQNEECLTPNPELVLWYLEICSEFKTWFFSPVAL